jgi:hypothetical protein
MTEDKIHLIQFVYKIQEQIYIRLREMKEQYPLLVDYFNEEERNLGNANITYQKMTSADDVIQIFATCSRILYNLKNIEFGGFSYLWDSKLYELMKMTMKNDLGVSNKWVKVLLTSNTLELALNKTLMIHKQSDFDKIKDKGIIIKMEEVNKILESKKFEKLTRSEVMFIKDHRVDADHPIPDIIEQLTDKSVSDVIEYTIKALTRLEPLLKE